ncbi:citrate lyase holo-[acyl-carrier protein] synthase [Lactobacillus psittaci]|uniref:citrate lyase holo-[acyl-carrier protein] synthase n=1 Tax=Lactobacillus psittaci DSM 15354 TaxID=1122152 RepID=A0A0R1SC91_9LACO|nr:citrate lyase holo-[acyl-carrier protein] synthase [Lactobacillus psittaci]KRL63683.1 holo-ACP synthase CitX [Lactobacillus psittaci DSM 15354]
MNIFESGQVVNIPEVLANKDERVALQNQLALANKNWSVIGAKLNIPGPVKNNELIRRFFIEQIREFTSNADFELELKADWSDKVTGPEFFYLAKAKPSEVKKSCVAFEESTKARRLFDLDVHYFDNGEIKDLSRRQLKLPGRTCLICGNNAKVCARARTHTVDELQSKVCTLICDELF